MKGGSMKTERIISDLRFIAKFDDSEKQSYQEAAQRLEELADWQKRAVEQIKDFLDADCECPECGGLDDRHTDYCEIGKLLTEAKEA